jgi:hypothetical protein
MERGVGALSGFRVSSITGEGIDVLQQRLAHVFTKLEDTLFNTCLTSLRRQWSPLPLLILARNLVADAFFL